MPSGMEIYASDGTLQASAELLTYWCRKSGTGTTATPTGIGNTVTSKAVVPINGMGFTYPIVAISCSGYYMARASNASNGDYQFASDAPVGTSFSYYVFDYSPVLPASTIGFEIYNASGQRTFSSNFHPMQVLTILGSGAVTHTGKVLAAGLPTMGGRRIAGAIDYYDSGFPVIPPPYDSTGYQNDSKLYGGKISNSGQTATYGTVSFDDVYIGPVFGDVYVPPDWSMSANVLAIDVTNIPASTTFF